MAADLSVTEVVNLLQRLVNERRILEKGLEIGLVLQGAQQKVKECEKQIPELEKRITELTNHVASLEQQAVVVLSDTQAKHSIKLAEYEEEIKAQQNILTSLRSDGSTQKNSLETSLSGLRLEIKENEIKYNEQKGVLEAQIKTLKQEFSSLRNKVLTAAEV